MIVLKSAAEIAAMREAGRLTAELMQALGRAVAPGISTADLDKLAKDFVARHKAVPTFLGYHGYPACICASVNEQVVHGIPGPRKLREGDLLSIDVGVTLGGWVGDMARSFAVGKAGPKVLDLMRVTEECLRLGIAQALPGGYLHDIGHAVQSHAEAHGYGVVREYCGHGIGQKMHEAPQVPNYGSAGSGVRLKAGMTIAIEPMVNTGAWETRQLEDGWTVVTADGGLSAHFEDTIAITESGPVVLTSL
jgi:methionyl aminopeptidase